MKYLRMVVWLGLVSLAASCTSPAPGPKASPEPGAVQTLERVRVSMVIVAMQEPTQSARLAFDNMGIPAAFSWCVDRRWSKNGARIEFQSVADFALSSKQAAGSRPWGDSDLVTMKAELVRPRRDDGRVLPYRAELRSLKTDARRADSLAAAAITAFLGGQADGEGWLRLESMALQGDTVMIEVRLWD